MRFPPLAGFGLTVALALLSSGCCGPMPCGPLACGPGGCGGGLALLGRGCENGCGELYIDPWINEPPACGDPCDACGNYNGQSCGSCRPVLSGTASLWGYRYDGGCDAGCDGGCDSCGGGCDGCGLPIADCGCGAVHGIPAVPTPADGPIQYGEPILHEARSIDGDMIIGHPPSAAQPIFQPRGSIARNRPIRAY